MWGYLILIVLVLPTLIRLAVVEIRRNKERSCPEKREIAMVRLKRWTEGNTGRGDTRDGGQIWWVTFETECGTILELAVGRSVYAVLAVGDRGVLTWQGTRCLNFEKRS